MTIIIPRYLPLAQPVPVKRSGIHEALEVVPSNLSPRTCGVSLAGLTNIHWIGLRENLQETMVFTIKYRAFL